jgi:hypothetical protein
MPSSISSSEQLIGRAALQQRETAADRPGVAQPVPLRPVPPQPWGRVFLQALLMFALLIGAWEGYWRAWGAAPGVGNSDGLWAMQRRRIDTGEGQATVIVGSSRVLFDLQLDVWEQLDGKRPIQLALEGTTPLPFMEDLADDPNFTGRLIVGVAPEVFFSDYGFRKQALRYFHSESPSQRVGQWLSMHLVEPVFAFDDPDYALATVLKRQAWPAREGMPNFLNVRKLSVNEADRNTHMWSKVENDPEYRALTRSIWTQWFGPSPTDPPAAERDKMRDAQIERAVKAVAKLRARGVQLLFVRAPSTGPYLADDERMFPRASSWDVLLKQTGAPGVHFQDYAELQGLEQPEWSHLSYADAKRFTASLHAIVVRDFWKANPPPAAAPDPAR